VIRFKDCIHVESDGETKEGAGWVPSNGRARLLKDARVTQEKYQVGAVVAVKRSGMKDNWLLATSLPYDAERIVQLYGRRFTIEENFRDEKDDRFGYGTLEVSIDSPARRSRFPPSRRHRNDPAHALPARPVSASDWMLSSGPTRPSGARTRSIPAGP
jgi:hypothetical protein